MLPRLETLALTANSAACANEIIKPGVKREVRPVSLMDAANERQSKIQFTIMTQSHCPASPLKSLLLNVMRSRIPSFVLILLMLLMVAEGCTKEGTSLIFCKAQTLLQ